ncbi:MAG: hypothetical protein ABI968_11630 [Acidobacteriota bacterium]
MKTKFLTGILLASAVALAAACTNKQGETESPVFITVNMELQPGFIDVSVPAPIQIQTITLDSHFKSDVATDPQHFADVSLTSYTVTFRRTDGGTLVPPAQTFGVGVLVPSGGSATLENFPVLAASAIQGSPFDQLLPFNGGIDRETGRAEIDLAFDITFFGTTVSGHRVQSETASGLLLFNSSLVPAGRLVK